MSTGYQINDQEGLYYLTFQIVDWIDIFTRQVYRDIVIESLRFAIENRNLNIFTFVIMSNYMHAIMQSSTGKLSDMIRDIKKFTSKRIIETVQSMPESRREWMINRFGCNARQHARNQTYQVWTHENHAVYLYGPKFIKEKLDYLHSNPVRAGLVEKPDPFIGNAASTMSYNRYAYCNGNPLKYTDPSGYWATINDMWDEINSLLKSRYGGRCGPGYYHKNLSSDEASGSGGGGYGYSSSNRIPSSYRFYLPYLFGIIGTPAGYDNNTGEPSKTVINIPGWIVNMFRGDGSGGPVKSPMSPTDFANIYGNFDWGNGDMSTSSDGSSNASGGGEDWFNKVQSGVRSHWGGWTETRKYKLNDKQAEAVLYARATGWDAVGGQITYGGAAAGGSVTIAFAWSKAAISIPAGLLTTGLSLAGCFYANKVELDHWKVYRKYLNNPNRSGLYIIDHLTTTIMQGMSITNGTTDIFNPDGSLFGSIYY